MMALQVNSEQEPLHLSREGMLAARGELTATSHHHHVTSVPLLPEVEAVLVRG